MSDINDTILVALHPKNVEEIEADRAELEVPPELLAGTYVYNKNQCILHKGVLAIILPEMVWFARVYEEGEFTILAGELEEQK